MAAPDLRGLTPRQRATIVNWTLPARPRSPPFSVFEKTVVDLQEAMTAGQVTSEDIVRDYLTRATLYDRNGPTFRAILALNPRAIADARARDAERAAGRVLGAYPRHSDRASRTTSTRRNCRPPAARGRWPTTVRASIRGSRRA